MLPDFGIDGQCEIVKTHVLIAETVWVMTSRKLYALDRCEVADKLITFIVQPGILCENSDALLDALQRFKDTRCDFFDCYLAAASGDSVASFDKDIRKFKDVAMWKPGK